MEKIDYIEIIPHMYLNEEEKQQRKQNFLKDVKKFLSLEYEEKVKLKNKDFKKAKNEMLKKENPNKKDMQNIVLQLFLENLINVYTDRKIENRGIEFYDIILSVYEWSLEYLKNINKKKYNGNNELYYIKSDISNKFYKKFNDFIYKNVIQPNKIRVRKVDVDKIAMENSSTEDIVIQNISDEQVREIVNSEKIEPDLRNILEKRFGLNENKACKYKEISENCNESISNIYQSIKALSKAKKYKGVCEELRNIR